MPNDHHESENLANLFDCILSGLMFEEGDKNIFKPVSVESLFFKVNLEDG